jgi:Protein of unknown function (DUF3089)
LKKHRIVRLILKMQIPVCRLLSVVILFLFSAGCSPKYSSYVSGYYTTANKQEPDYANLYYWAAHPWKKDPSDSVPKPLRAGYTLDSTADVFFIHPTTFTGLNEEKWNADINDATINAKTDYSTILYQASAFNEYRVFAPRYRQAHIRAYYTTDTAMALQAFDLAYADIKTAFQYYLDHYNNGRPVIIASHSQGSTHAQRLLKDFFENSNLKSRLVVAYIAGMYIPGTYFTDLKMCSDSLQTGCICGWRTFKKGYEPAFIKKEKGSGWVTNPLSWTTTTEYAASTLNKGSVLRNFNQVNYSVTGAQIHEGVLWIGRLHVPGGFLLKMKNFHIGDINIFYLNIREDVKRRVTVFRKQ